MDSAQSKDADWYTKRAAQHVRSARGTDAERVTVERDGFAFSAGDGGDLSWDDVATLRIVARKHGVDRVSADVMRAIVLTMRAFPGSAVVS